MQFTITFKTPDAMDDGIRRALADMGGYEDVIPEPDEMDMDSELAHTMEQVAEKFIKWGEYITVQFDTDTKTATVLPAEK